MAGRPHCPGKMLTPSSASTSTAPLTLHHMAAPWSLLLTEGDKARAQQHLETSHRNINQVPLPGVELNLKFGDAGLQLVRVKLRINIIIFFFLPEMLWL